MQDKNAVTNEYFNVPERFADLVNGFVFEGRQLVEAGDVLDRGEIISRIISEEEKMNTKTVTIVVYWGRKAWDGPRCLKEMLKLGDYPLELQKYIVDYPIHIFEVRKYAHTEHFQTDIRYVLGFLQKDRDPKALAEYVQENRETFSMLPESTYNVISKMSRSRELNKVKAKVKKEEGYDMCQAITEMIREGKREGIREGLREGKLIGIREGKREGRLTGMLEGSANMLLAVLQRLGEVSEELEKEIRGEKDLAILTQWFQQAMDAGSVAEFEQGM